MADLPVGNEGPTNGTTAVTALAAPASSAQRVVSKGDASVSNGDTIDHIVIWQKNKGGTITELSRGVAALSGGTYACPKRVVLDATNESLEVKLGEAISSIQPKFDVAALETT